MLLRRRITVAVKWKGPAIMYLKKKGFDYFDEKKQICITYPAASVPVRNLVKSPGFGSWVEKSPMNLRQVQIAAEVLKDQF